MSRRESRNSLGVRQTSALEEFENFKKKYLLVNKHIAKLNSSLNVRIEELLGQIASLNADNMKLRAAELTLHRKLENEQERTRRLYRETESASQLLISQICSMKVMFGLDKPATYSFQKDNAASRQRVTKQPHPPPACRIARAPECEMITEAAEEEYTPSRTISPRQSTSPTPGPATPVSRRRSTGSTPHSTPASGPATSPGGTVYSVVTQGRKSDEERRSSGPPSMEITNGSSPLTPYTPTPIATEPVVVSPISAPNVHSEQFVESPSSDRSPIAEKGTTDNATRLESTPSLFNPPKINLTGLKRVARRHSGFITEDEIKEPQPAPASLPPTSTETNEASTYLAPTSTPPAPSTPPRGVSSIRMPGSRSPSTPNRTLPMSPVPANPALSPPPGRKLSLTRRQLDFGIPEPEEPENEENEENEAPIDAVEPVAEGLLGFQNDSVVGKRAVKRKGPEDEEQEDADIFSVAVKPHGVRAKRHEKRRDTGNPFTLKDKDSRESLLKERGSKDSLRDVTNERTPPSLIGSRAIETKDFTSPPPRADDGAPAPTTNSSKSYFSRGTVADLAAKLERLSSRPKPLGAPAPIPLPSSDKDVKIPLEEEEQANDAGDAGIGDIGRRNSGRQRKSVNYKEPSLNTKMRKPDPITAPTVISSAPSSSSTAGSSAGTTPTLTPSSAPRPPKRKKGSISLVGDVNGSTPSIVGKSGEDIPTTSSTTLYSLYATTGDAESRRSSKLDLLEPPSGSGDVQRTSSQKRNSRNVWEKYIDLSDEEDGVVIGGSKESQPAAQAESGGLYLSSETGSRYSFAGLSGLRAGSILAKGNNPILSNATNGTTVRSTASLRAGPGVARERLREELIGGSSGKKEREKERERERERDLEQEDERGSKTIAT